jgi:probable rRNA maturation factor
MRLMDVAEPRITVLYRRAGSSVDRRAVRRFAEALRGEVAGGREFVCLLTDDAELRRLNTEFLGHEYPTDVLSFPSGAAEGPMGDIAISVQRAAEQARTLGHALEDELRILMLHGVLHLLGMDHESDRGQMSRAERRWRERFGLPHALTERARRGRTARP